MTQLQFATKLAYQAGKIIKTNFSLGMEKSWKADGTPLTITDTTINQFVLEAVKKSYPKHDVLAEEGSSLKNKSDYVWVCDPVDGTIPFSHSIPTCVFSLALTHLGKVQLGVVYDPFCDRLYTAQKGKGAFLNNKPIKISTTPMNQALISLTFWGNAKIDVTPLIKPIIKTGAQIINICSVIYTGALTACGEFAATIFPGNLAHDAATVKILVEEAGGTVTDIFGNDQRYDRPTKGYIASNKFLHPQLLKMVKEYVKL